MEREGEPRSSTGGTTTREDLEEIAHRYFAERHTAREASLAIARLLIRHAGNAIRAVHRRDAAGAAELLAKAATAVAEIKGTLAALPELYYSGYVLDALKEYAEAVITRDLVLHDTLPTLESLPVGHIAYFNGLAEAVGELRRFTLDGLRHGDIAGGERLLRHMEMIYELLITLDYPDAVTGSLRRSTDGARGILEKTRGDLTSAAAQARLEEALRLTREAVSGRP
ncbi:MAG: haloacid dehalogenase [Chloroflexota bacterium]